MRGSLTSSARNVATSSRMASATRSARRFSAGMIAVSGAGRAQSPGYLFGSIAFEDIANFDVVEVLDADAALETIAHLANVVLEAPERCDAAIEDLDAITNHAQPALTIDDTTSHETAGDGADTRDLEDLANLRLAENDFALLGPEHAFHRRAHVGYRFIDDAVQLDVDAFALRGSPGVVVGANVEAD